MNINKNRIFNKISLSLILLIPIKVWGSCSGNSPTWNSTPDYTSLNTCVNSAKPGDTINVSFGSATWTSTLQISGGINLIGSGIGNTVISGTLIPLILYTPSAANAVNNYPFRLSGFSFNLSGTGEALILSSNESLTLQTNIRIDHNYFYNSTTPAGGINNLGLRGVIDHNTFDTFSSPIRSWGDMQSGQFWWDNFPVINYGTAENMYIEDNIFTNLGGYMLSDSDTGGRFVFRYNTISVNQGMYPLLDIHGGSAGSNPLWGAFGGEVYGNLINSGGYSGSLISQRGGKLLLFNNSAAGWGINVYDNNGCPPSDHYNDQLINNSYYFNNRNNSTGAPSIASITADNCGYISQNVDFWQDASPFNGTVGVGCGTQANLPAACTTGVGYWATNQSCSNISGQVGTSPSSPASGTLYVCTSTNTWSAYYTPYTYPHPLTNGILLSPPSNLMIQ